MGKVPNAIVTPHVGTFHLLHFDHRRSWRVKVWTGLKLVTGWGVQAAVY